MSYNILIINHRYSIYNNNPINNIVITMIILMLIIIEMKMSHLEENFQTLTNDNNNLISNNITLQSTIGKNCGSSYD